MEEIDATLTDMLNDACTLLKVIDGKLGEILKVLYTLKEVVEEKERQRGERVEGSKTWIKFATMKITPDPLFYALSHPLPHFPNKKLVRCDISIRNGAIGEEISIRICDAQGREIIEESLLHDGSDSFLLTNDAAYIQARSNLMATGACVELALFAKESADLLLALKGEASSPQEV